LNSKRIGRTSSQTSKTQISKAPKESECGITRRLKPRRLRASCSTCYPRLFQYIHKKEYKITREALACLKYPQNKGISSDGLTTA
jgi:hypothetical protein